jgi:hypothetical protein
MTVHWGIVGERGQYRDVNLFSGRKEVKKELEDKIKEGYREFEEDEMAFLEVIYTINDFGTEQYLEKRHELEEYLNELLGWTGLGHVDGGSIGSGTMEVDCLVVDFDMAKKVIENDLKNTIFGDYLDICKMEE